MTNHASIEMAARGCVSGSLMEWPALNAALQSRGIDLPPNTPAYELRRVCQGLLARQLTTTEAAVLLGISPSQTRRLARQGRIQGAEFIGRDWLYKEPLTILPPKRPKGWPRRVNKSQLDKSLSE